MLKSLLRQVSILGNGIRQLNKKLTSNEYYIVYKNKEGETKTYLVGDIDLYSSFSNKRDGRNNAGFKAYCFARDEVRSFRHDRIISITKK